MARHVNFNDLEDVPVTHEDLPAVVRAARRADQRKGPTLTVVPQLPPAPEPEVDPVEWPEATFLGEWTRGAFEVVDLPRLPWARPETPVVPAPVIAPAPVLVAPPTPSPIPAPEASVPVQPPAVVEDTIEEMGTRPAWHVIRVIATAWSVLQLGIVATGAYHFAGLWLGAVLALLIVGTSWALGLPGVARLAHEAGADKAMRLLHGVIALAILQAGFVAYYMHQAPHDDSTLAAREAHGAFQVEVWAPTVKAVETARGVLAGIDYRLVQECARGGCKSKAAVIEAEKARAMQELATAEAKRDALAAYFGVLPDNADAIHANDVAAAAVAGVSTPARSEYVEPDLLRPYYRLAAADPFAVLSFALALLFDGVGIVLQMMQHVILHRRHRGAQ